MEFSLLVVSGTLMQSSTPLPGFDGIKFSSKLVITNIRTHS
jgi:hypothetical protein